MDRGAEGGRGGPPIIGHSEAEGEPFDPSVDSADPETPGEDTDRA